MPHSATSQITCPNGRTIPKTMVGMDNAQYGLSKKKKTIPKTHRINENLTSFVPMNMMMMFDQ